MCTSPYCCNDMVYTTIFRDTAYSGLAIDSHTDGNYFHEAPGELS